jgi:hypothetical protein
MAKKKDLVESESGFSFEFEGNSDISAEALREILDKTIALTREIAALTPDAYAKLKVTKVSTGSFDIDFMAVATAAITLFSSNPVNAASTMVDMVLSAFSIAKHIQGKRPKELKKTENGTIVIINSYGDRAEINGQIVDTYFKNPKMDNLITSIAETAEKENRAGLLIAAQDTNRIIHCSGNDLSLMKPVVRDMLEQDERIEVTSFDTVLLIRKPDLTGTAQ